MGIGLHRFVEPLAQVDHFHGALDQFRRRHIRLLGIGHLRVFLPHLDRGLFGRYDLCGRGFGLLLPDRGRLLRDRHGRFNFLGDIAATILAALGQVVGLLGRCGVTLVDYRDIQCRWDIVRWRVVAGAEGDAEYHDGMKRDRQKQRQGNPVGCRDAGVEQDGRVAGCFHGGLYNTGRPLI